MQSNIRTLNFLPLEALRSFFRNEGVIGAKDSNNKLAGYLIYTAYQEYFRITQLCVSEEFRGKGIAKSLVDELKGTATTQKVIKLNCRRDFDVSRMWPKLGFVALDEKPGRSAKGSTLTIWCFDLAPENQLDLFRAKTSDDTLDAVIDANILFDFDEQENDRTKPSKALLSDSWVDSLALFVTGELFNEINRKKDNTQRETSRQRAHHFPKVGRNSQSVEHFKKILKKFLPSRRDNQESDINHLAEVAASDVNIFVTRDEAILNEEEKILDQTNVQVITPTNLIIQLHKLSNQQSYASTYVSGVNLGWRRLNTSDLESLPLHSFLNQGERMRRFKEKLESFLAEPNRCECEILKSSGETIAVRVLENNNKVLTVHLSRLASSVNRSSFEHFLGSDTIHKAVTMNLDIVKFEVGSVTNKLIPHLFDTGFTKHNDSYIRFCFSRCLSQQQVLSEIVKLCPESKSSYQDMKSIELEKYCSPLTLEPAHQKCFLVPIRPDYAISLFDRYQAAYDLFGGETDVFLRWKKVYYRKKSQHRMLKAPARILWYVSREMGQIVAVSCLDNVVIDTPKILFKRFKKRGILKWEDIYEMSEGDVSKEIMALEFSHTFSFRNPISYNAMKNVFENAGTGLSVQGPLKIPEKIFHELFRLGYPN